MENRILSIDVFRGITMLLMVWVNDFWSLSNIPSWLEHAPADADALGFSDTIFPAFLFIVGLSIPFALRSRLARGGSKPRIVAHILIRSFSLLLMGVLMVNLENYHQTSALLPRSLWQVVMTIAFFLIWNNYPSSDNWSKRQTYLKAAGWILILGLAITFRSDPNSGYNWIQPHWWGILGLIGWSYLVCSITQLFIGPNLIPTLAAWLGFAAFNYACFAGLLDSLAPMRSYIWIVGDGSLPALTMAGCFASVLYQQLAKTQKQTPFLLLLLGSGFACIALGLLLRPYWGISKIQSTPAWTEICTGFSFLTFALIYWLVDLQRYKAWAKILKPAGSATLTCYLLPYLVYPLMEASGLSLPAFLKTGLIGLSTSMAFALLIVVLTGQLTRIGIKLRL